MAEEQDSSTSVKQDLYSGMIDHRSDDLIKWILNPGSRVDEFIDRLAGKEFNPDTGMFEAKPENMIMNEKCVNYLKGVLRGFMNPDIIMTRYDDDEIIRKMAEPLAAHIIIDMSLNRGRYALEPTKLPIIFNEIQNLLISTLRRGLKQGERNWLSRQATYETKQIEAPRKASFLQGFMPGRK